MIKEPHGIDVGRAALHQVAGGGLVVIGDADVLKMVIEPIAELAGNRFARQRGPLAFEISECAADGGDGDHANAGDEQRAAERTSTQRVDEADKRLLPFSNRLLLDQPIDGGANDERREIEQRDADGHGGSREDIASALPGGEVPEGPELVAVFDHGGGLHPQKKMNWQMTSSPAFGRCPF